MVRARARDLERFQSMLPVGGATSLSSWLHLRLTNFNSRSPRGERQESTQIRYFHPYFNPRSPRGERLGARSSVSAPSLFQSTLSVGRATTSCRRPCASCGNFNPRSPRGERQQTYPKCCVAVWIDFLIFEKDAYKIKTKIITKWDF